MDYTKFCEIKSIVLDSLDVAEEYRKMGVEITGSAGHAAEWVQCRAFGKADSNPSAEICLRGKHVGQYIDFSGGIGEGRSLSIFDFAVAVGAVENWTDALKQYAAQLGLEYPQMRSPERLFNTRSFIPALAETWSRNKHTSPTAIQRAGGFLADYPAAKANSDICVMLPLYDQYGPGGHPCGYVAWKRNGQPFQMKNAAPKMLTLKNSDAGLMGREALENLDRAEIVWKVEGPTDMLALMEAIPEDLRGKHVVLTNSAGCMENPKPWVLELLAGKTVYVLGDADKPGQKGAERWTRELAAKSSVKNVVLPYEISANHGRDVRDYLQEGNSYEQLLELAQAVPEPSETLMELAPTDPLELHRAMLESLGIEPLGEYIDQAIAIFSRSGKKMVKIRDLDKLSYAKLVQIAGDAAMKNVVEDSAESGQISLRQVRLALALCCRENIITTENTKGQGIWLTRRGHVVLVGKGEALIWDGTNARTISNPRYEEFLLDVSSGETFWPEDFADELEHYNPEDGTEALKALGRILCRWKWESPNKNPNDPVTVVAGLVLATFIQTVFRFRPMVSITGESESGKTTLIQTIVSLFSGLGEKLSNVTEAAIRQYIGTSARPLFLDEFEYSANRQKIFELLRTSSDGSKQIRGTQEQKVKSYGLQHITWVLAIEINLQRAPDANRFIEFSLKRPTAEESGKLDIPPMAELEALGKRLMLATVYHAANIARIAEELSRCPIAGKNTREIQNFSAPAAAVSCLLDEEPERVLVHLMNNVVEKEVESDQNDLFTTLMMCPIKYRRYVDDGQSEYTLGRLIELYLLQDPKADEIEEVLLNYGIRIGNDPKTRSDQRREGIFFAKNGLDTLLKFTDWRGQSSVQILKRMTGVEESRCRCGSFGNTRGVMIPIYYFIPESKRESETERF